MNKELEELMLSKGNAAESAPEVEKPGGSLYSYGLEEPEKPVEEVFDPEAAAREYDSVNQFVNGRNVDAYNAGNTLDIPDRSKSSKWGRLAAGLADLAMAGTNIYSLAGGGSAVKTPDVQGAASKRLELLRRTDREQYRQWVDGLRAAQKADNDASLAHSRNRAEWMLKAKAKVDDRNFRNKAAYDSAMNRYRLKTADLRQKEKAAREQREFTAGENAKKMQFRAKEGARNRAQNAVAKDGGKKIKVKLYDGKTTLEFDSNSRGMYSVGGLFQYINDLLPASKKVGKYNGRDMTRDLNKVLAELENCDEKKRRQVLDTYKNYIKK